MDYAMMFLKYRSFRKGKAERGKQPMKTVEVKVSYNYTKEGKKATATTDLLPKEKWNLAILGENMADFTALAKQYGSGPVLAEDGKTVITPSEKENPMLFIASAVRRDIEYGRGVRNQLRNSIEELVAGPAKTIAKQVKFMVDSFGYTEADASTFVIAQRKSKGLPV